MDAYIIIYSVDNKDTFNDAVDVLHEIRKEKERNNAAVILVANKQNLVKSRHITVQAGLLLDKYILSLQLRANAAKSRNLENAKIYWL